MSLNDLKEINSFSYISVDEKQKEENDFVEVEKTVYISPYFFKNDQKNSENFSADLYDTKKPNFNKTNKRKRASLVSYVSDEENSCLFSENKQQCDDNQTISAQFSTDDEKSDSARDTKSSDNDFNTPEPSPSSNKEISELGFNDVILLRQTDHLREMRTILRDKFTKNSEFVFYADRLFRLVVEEGLNQMPSHSLIVKTPSGCNYEGIRFSNGNCGVSVSRSGEAMELALRQCCRSIRIGKILIADDCRVLYARLMTNIMRRRVLLLYPIMTTGNTASKAVEVLLENGVNEKKIFLITAFCIKYLRNRFKELTLITSEVCTDVPGFFATRYFGTD